MLAKRNVRFKPGEIITNLLIVEFHQQLDKQRDFYLVEPTCGLHKEQYFITHKRLVERMRLGKTNCKFCAPNAPERIERLKDHARKRKNQQGMSIAEESSVCVEFIHPPWKPYRPRERLTEGVDYGCIKRKVAWYE